MDVYIFDLPVEIKSFDEDTSIIIAHYPSSLVQFYLNEILKEQAATTDNVFRQAKLVIKIQGISFNALVSFHINDSCVLGLPAEIANKHWLTRELYLDQIRRTAKNPEKFLRIVLQDKVIG